MEKDRIILHCDCNSFYASVETALNPRYRGIPMAVGGSEEARHGIILAKNEEAKAYGVTTAETIRSAKRKCPNLLIVPPHFDQYARYSRAVHQIYRRYTDFIEPFGLDEAWLDISKSQGLFGDGMAVAERILKEVREEIGITVSIGISFNKVFAKFGSDYKKPNAITAITRENYASILYPLSVNSLLFVGKRTAEELRRFGILTLGDLAAASRSFLASRFGKSGSMIYDYVTGADESPVANYYEDTPLAKNIGNGMTFKRDLTTLEELYLGIDALSEEIAFRMRKVKLCAGTVTLSLKDANLDTVSRQMPTETPTDIGREIADTAKQLLKSIWKPGKAIRSVRVAGSNFTERDKVTEQITFFDDGKTDREKLGRIENALDKVRERYGYTAVVSGATIDNEIGIDGGAASKKKTPQKKSENM